MFLGSGPATEPAGWRCSATAHQTTASHPDTTEWDHLSSGWTGTGSKPALLGLNRCCLSRTLLRSFHFVK